MKPIRCRFGLKVIGFMISMEKKVLDREWNSGKLYNIIYEKRILRFDFRFRLNHISQAMVSHQCFLKQNEYSNVKYRMNFARMNSTISGGDDDNKYRFYGIDMGQYGDAGMDWMEPQRRIYAEGEISMGCLDLDGTTVGLKGGSFLGKFSDKTRVTAIKIATKHDLY